MADTFREEIAAYFADELGRDEWGDWTLEAEDIATDDPAGDVP